MTLNTFLEIVERHFPGIKKLAEQREVELVDFYGLLYNISYNQSMIEAKELYVDFFKEIGAKKSLEVLAGNAFESSVIASNIESLEAHSVDVLDYFEGAKMYDNVKYIKGDCFKDLPPANDYDVVFVGSTNASGCAIKNLRDLEAFFQYCSKAVKSGGHLIFSCYTDSGSYEIRYSLTTSKREAPIMYGTPYEGYNTVWYQINEADYLRETHTYIDFVSVVDKEGNVVRNLYHNGSQSVFRSWQTITVIEVAEKYGFSILEDKINTERFLPFIKK